MPSRWMAPPTPKLILTSSPCLKYLEGMKLSAKTYCLPQSPSFLCLLLRIYTLVCVPTPSQSLLAKVHHQLVLVRSLQRATADCQRSVSGKDLQWSSQVSIPTNMP